MTTPNSPYATGLDPDTNGGVHRSRIDSTVESVAEAVVMAVAELTGIDPLAVESLNAAIDPDALNALFGDQLDGTVRSGGGVFFQLNDCDVTVHSDGEIVVRR